VVFFRAVVFREPVLRDAGFLRALDAALADAPLRLGAAFARGFARDEADVRVDARRTFERCVAGTSALATAFESCGISLPR
jgi:hypothetical protein